MCSFSCDSSNSKNHKINLSYLVEMITYMVRNERRSNGDEATLT